MGYTVIDKKCFIFGGNIFNGVNNEEYDNSLFSVEFTDGEIISTRIIPNS